MRQVLDHLERDDRVELGVAALELLQVADGELDVPAAVARARVVDRLLAHVDADDAACGLAEERAAVAHAATRVEHALADAVRPRELVALQVQRDDPRLGLVRHDALRMAQRSLTTRKYPSTALLELLRRMTLGRAVQLALAATIVTMLLAAGSILQWLEPARNAPLGGAARARGPRRRVRGPVEER